MPQLVAIIIVVVGAIVYMFQTFGGTGDTIVGVAQKTSVITEINNIKNGLKFAANERQISLTNFVAGANPITLNNLNEMQPFGYFDQQIATQLAASAALAANPTTNIYNAISFGGTAMQISLVANVQGAIPGIFVRLQGELTTNAGFLESQIANDLAGIAYIDRTAIVGTLGGAALNAAGTAIQLRTPVDAVPAAATQLDGQFTIYFNDFGARQVVQP